MQAILAEVGALMGVKGSFVCGRDGGLIVRVMPDGTNDAGLAAIGRSLMQTLTGLEVDRRKRASEMEFAYANGLMLIKNLGAGCLCVLCARQANVAMVNMTTNMAARKLKEALATAKEIPGSPAPTTATMVAPPAAAPVPAAAPAAQAGAPCLAASLITRVEHELARAIGPVAMLAVDDSVAAMGFTRETLPVASASAWLERLGGEIVDAGKRAQFVQAAQKIVGGG